MATVDTVVQVEQLLTMHVSVTVTALHLCLIYLGFTWRFLIIQSTHAHLYMRMVLSSSNESHLLGTELCYTTMTYVLYKLILKAVCNHGLFMEVQGTCVCEEELCELCYM